MNDPQFECKDPDIEELLREIGRRIRSSMPPDYGFTLFLMNYRTEENPGSLFYISSVIREDMIKLLKEFLRKQGETSL